MSSPAGIEYDPPRPRLTGDERRRTILDAARQEFSRTGYHGASTASIARAAGCSEPMLYKHFSGKQALFTAALRDALDVFQSTFDHDHLRSSGTMLDRGIDYVHRAMSHPAFIQMLHLRKIASMNVDQPEVRATLEAVERQTWELADRALRRGIEEGIIRPDVDTDYVVTGWLGFLFASCYRDALQPGTFADQARHVETFMRSLCVEPSALS